ncbi:Processing alpha glucosidase I [Coemansia thaxteri]|uniref:Mannosyl-oligosaccharide glucosidase n=1 Tax=Coemansia thaxteri TaxID=2663907 RepID=A0A9W8ELY5_9FUNG|nr:Processing alpha glucosidase I [Coemansia thaxteri]KAJ2007738.1 Processing alpha glucosidase I [Coemansia thaxteri]KAJ2472843.1 Processing alpha glucosidase I [Coemansia sp. RSA 2322]KAJ2487500.1 Processing alpha glucosidase I [Coemansia sp. RSA 2320]
MLSVLALTAGLQSDQCQAQQQQQELDSSLWWGTYRPNLYFGTRPRLPSSLVSGLMWFGLDDRLNWQRIRHSCELGDNLAEYGYSRHNGRDFGEQSMLDNDQGVEIKSTFIKVPGERGGSWAVRFTGRTLAENMQGVSLAYYFGLEGNGTISMAVKAGAAQIKGSTPDLGKFRIRIVPAKSNRRPPVPSDLRNSVGVQAGSKINGVGMRVAKADIWKAKDLYQDKLLESARARINAFSEYAENAGSLPGSILFGMDNSGLGSGNNLFIAQMVVHGEFSFDVIYECEDKSARIDSDAIVAIASNRRKEFDSRFEAIFGLAEKGFSPEQIEMARNALSNLIGGIGYFYGSGLVSSEPKPDHIDGADDVVDAELSEPYALFATTPSRPFFPRGFLWDEGFHQLVLGQWDSDLGLEIVRSWFRTMDDNGWIAREQILGDEARNKVPREFQVQYPNFANPPTILFTVEALADRLLAQGLSSSSKDDMLQAGSEQSQEGVCDELHLLRSKLADLAQYSVRLLEFFQNTQAGDKLSRVDTVSPSAFGYRWRGRTENHTLTSGLDDYPRARLPSKYELHVDLFSWATFMTRLNTELASLTESDNEASELRKTGGELKSHLEQLDEIHWNEHDKMYCDVTMQVRDDYDELEDEDGSGGLERVFVCHRGYVSLFPMLLGLVSPNSGKLGHILDMIEDPEELWTEYGVRSLSKNDEYYGQGENYWRGPIWININYLVLSSLHRNYMTVKGPYQEQARRIYTGLRENLVNNVFAQYRDTRFFWEQYNPESGSGQRTHPFTGWTTLIVNVMAEKY